MEQKQKKKLIVILALLIVIVLFAGISYLNASIFNLTQFHITTIKEESSELPDSFNDATIMFFSDLEYGTYFNEGRLDQFIDTADDLQCDFILFGGDLFDAEFSPVNEDVVAVTERLKKLKAPYGKFAILGEMDQTNDMRKALVTKVLNDAGFEVIDRLSLQVHHNSKDSINLIGFNYTEDISSFADTFANIQPENYTLTLVHGALAAETLPLSLSDLTLSGHTHHLQVILPFVVDYEAYPLTGKYSTGSHKLSNTTLYLTRGVGTTRTDYRFYSDPEIVYIRLNKKK